MLKWSVPVGVWLILLVAACWVLGDEFSSESLLAWQGQMKAWMTTYPVGTSMCYGLLFAGLTVLCLPGAGLLMLLAGGCMDPVWGTLLSNTASVLGAWGTFALSRTLLRAPVQSRWGQYFSKLRPVMENPSPLTLLGLRLAPIIPFAPFNALMGLTHLSHSRFLWTSFVGMLPGTAVYINAGYQLSVLQTTQNWWSPGLWLSAALLLALPWVGKTISPKV